MSQLIEKKNRQMYFDGANEHQCFGLRKLTIGVASVLLGATLFLGGHTQEAHADTLNTSAPMKNDTSTGEKAASQELSNASQDNVPTNPKVEQAKTPATGTSQSQSASVTSEAQSTNTYSSQASQNKSATLNTDNAHQATQSANATPTVNSQVKAPVQAHGQVPEANYTPAQASQNKSAALNTYNANKVASQVQSSTVNSNGTNNTQEANNASSMLTKVPNKTNVTNANSATNTSSNNLAKVQNKTNVTNANSAINTSSNNLATNNTQDYGPNNPVNNKGKINHDALNKANKQANLVLKQPQAIHANNLANNNAQNSVPRLSRNLKDNLNNVDNRQLKQLENNLMVFSNTNPYLPYFSSFISTDGFASTGNNDGNDVNISWPSVPANQTVKDNSQYFIPQPGEHYDTTQGIKTVTRNVGWYIIKANDTTIPTGHTVIDTINFYEPQAKDDQGHLLPEYSWAHWNNSLDQHFTDRALETEQILHDNNNIRLDHVYGGTSADVAGATLITPDSQNQNIKVYFKEGKISTLIRFVDSDSNNGSNDGDQVVLSELSIEGPQGSYIDDTSQLSKIKTTLQNYLNQGFKVEDGGNPFSPQIDRDPDADPNAVESVTAQYRPVDGDPDNTAINIMLDHTHKTFGGQQNTPNPKTGQKDKKTQSVVNRIISYVYDNGSPVMNTNNQPSKAKQTLEFSRQADVDMVTGNVIYATWDRQGTFAAVTSPAIDGYTPDKAIVPAQTVNATDPDSNVTVTYKQNVPVNNDASGQVNYIDDNNNGNVIKTGGFNGKVGDPITYSTQPTIKDLQNKGYELVSDNFGTTPHTFKDGNNNYEVHFKHSYETVKPGNEKTPGTPINPNDPNGPKWPNGTDKNSVERTGKRTINYTGAYSQTPQPKVDTINFTRQVVVDKVTGQINSATDWQPTSHQFDQVKTPLLDGYTPDKAIVPEQTVNATDPDINITVTYYKKAPYDGGGFVFQKDASGQVNYIDDNNNGNVIKTGGFNGKVGDPITYSTQPTIKDLQNKGYELVSDNFGTTPHTFKDGNNNYEVHFKHSYETVKPGNEKTPGTPINPNDPNGPKWPNGTDKNSVERTGKRTINYTGANSQTPQPKIDTTNFTRQVVVDKVTGQINSATDWQPTSHQFDQVKTPFINYFYADKLYAGNLSVSPSNLEATDLVTYQPMANIIPVDEGHHKIPNVPNPQYTTNPQDPTKATPNQLVPSIQNMVPDQKTVTPINPGQPTEVIYRESKIPTKRKAARLIFKLNDTNTQNITDLRQIQSLPTMLTDGTSGAPMNEKTIPDVYTVNSSGVVSGPDDGDTSKWRAIANANGVNLDVPAQAGYTWKIAKITGTDTSQDIYFVYSKAPDQSSLNVVVHDNTTNQDLPQYGYYHKDAPGTTINYDWPTQKQHLIDNGYKIVNEPTVPSTIPDKPQTITITVEHDVAPDNNTDHKHTPGTLINPQEPNGPKWPAKDNFTKDYTYTVNFNDQNGNKVADPQHQVSTWNRTVYVDKVTGEIKPDQSTPWTPDKPNYGNTNVPVVNGYVANKTSKNGSPVSNILPGPKTEQNNTTDTVTYNTVGKIVPVDPSGKSIPGAEQPKYINDPKDPTKVTPNEKVPVLPGKTPRQTSVTPVNPTKDTHIIYDDATVDTNLKVIVHDQTDNRDLTDYGFNSGTVKSGTRVLYTFNQDRQKLIDHGYEIVNVPAIPTVYGKKPQTVTITVKHAVAPVDTSLKVIVYDQTDNHDLTGYGFNSGTVKSGTRVPYTFNQDNQKLIDHGYEIVNVPEIPTVYGKKPQTVTITVKHAVAPVNNQDHKHTPGTPVNPNDPNGPKWPAKDNYSQDHTYTVSFSGPDGKQLAGPKTQTSHWNRTLNIDKVTGQILNPHEPWQSDITNYQDTKVPVINGYVANKTSKNGSPVSKILPGAKAVPSDITDTVQYGKIGRIIPVDSSGKPIPGASTPMYENDPDDPTKVKRTNVPYIKGYTPSVDSVDPKDPTKDTNVVYQKDQPDIVPDNPNENLPSVPNDSNNDLGNFKTPKKKAKKAPAKKAQGPTKQAPVNNNAKQPANNNNAKQFANNNNAGPANKAKAPVANVAQAATLPNKVITKQAPTNNAKQALPQTGEDQNDLMILAVGSLLGAMSLATLAGTRRKRKHE